jgi:hypothetical protein
VFFRFEYSVLTDWRKLNTNMFHVKLLGRLDFIKNLDMRIVDKVVLSLQEKEVLY